VEATSPIPRLGRGVAARGRQRSLATLARGTLGTGALAGLLACGLLLAASAASRQSTLLVPSAHGRFPRWLAGPLLGLGVPFGTVRWQLEVVGMALCYGLALACLPGLGPRRVLAAIVGAHVIFALGPPLLSSDVFGYIDYARLGVVHHLDPYTHDSLAAGHDPVFRFLGWHHAKSPYGPLFTLLSYALVPLGVVGGLWTLKALAAAFSLATVALLWRAARAVGRSPLAAAVLFGLNPVVLIFGVGGAHNDTMLVALMAAALLLALTGRWASGAVTVVVGVGIKASAGLMLPFLLLGARRRARAALGAAVASAALLVALALIGFGSQAAGFLTAIRGQQGLVAVHSVPAQVGRLLGAPTLEPGVRTAFVVAFAVVVVLALWRTWAGADWVRAAGWTTLALLLSTAWLLPWYAIWLLPFTALRSDRALRTAALLFCAYALLTRLPFADPALSSGVL